MKGLDLFVIKWQELFFTKLRDDKTPKILSKKLLKMVKKILVVVLLYEP